MGRGAIAKNFEATTEAVGQVGAEACQRRVVLGTRTTWFSYETEDFLTIWCSGQLCDDLVDGLSMIDVEPFAAWNFQAA